eukprot:UN11468
MQNIMENGVPQCWSNRLNMQSMYSLEERGWQISVYWKQSEIPNAGIALFANQDVPKGTIMRKFIVDQRMLIFEDENDLPFLNELTLQYLADYTFRFNGKCCCVFPGASVNHSPGNSNHAFDR